MRALRVKVSPSSSALDGITERIFEHFGTTCLLGFPSSRWIYRFVTFFPALWQRKYMVLRTERCFGTDREARLRLEPFRVTL